MSAKRLQNVLYGFSSIKNNNLRGYIEEYTFQGNEKSPDFIVFTAGSRARIL